VGFYYGVPLSVQIGDRCVCFGALRVCVAFFKMGRVSQLDRMPAGMSLCAFLISAILFTYFVCVAQKSQRRHALYD